MSQIDNIIIQVRARLQESAIKLWLEPYYYPDVGSVESEIDRLAEDFSANLSISISNCKLALNELQDGALRKLEARKEFDETGVATFSVRRINNDQGTQNIFEIKSRLSVLGSELQRQIADKLNIGDANQVKCISAGKIVLPDKTLESQGLKNSQQLMVIISALDSGQSTSKAAMYDRIRKIKLDVEAIVDSKRELFQMEDQDGNSIFLPPEENRAILMAMGFCEKARAAMKREEYDEALILLLEADEKFSTCNSKFLESVDNYALVNLDIVWCYLCLKNVTQLPDAQRRLTICEKVFKRSYGENMSRLIALRGSQCPERALLMRLHLLQGVLFFHNNERDAAYERLELAASELQDLKVNETDLSTLVEMGYEIYEARLALRAASGNIEAAVNKIHERREQLAEARKRSKGERSMNAKLVQSTDGNKDWVNPRSVCTLTEMGFDTALAVEALKRTENDVPLALELLQTSAEELRASLPTVTAADEDIVKQLNEIGFTEVLSRYALQNANNNIEQALDFLMKLFRDESQLNAVLARLEGNASSDGGVNDAAASTSTAANLTLLRQIMEKAKEEIESLKAYQRFNEDVNHTDLEYLDLPLVQEEQILAEYKRLLE